MKDILGGILALVTITAFILLIIGLFSPKTALFWYKKNRTKKASALINGLIFLTSFICCGIILPPPPADGTTSTEVPASSATSSAAVPPGGTATDPNLHYQVAKVEHDGQKIECNVVIDDIYPEADLIEKTRQLRDEYKVKSDFTCDFYYKKYTDKARCIAVFSYWKDCKDCEGRDKNGDALYADYTLTKERAESLRALKFDTAGYKQEASYLTATPVQKDILFSSADSEALIVFHQIDGYTSYRLVKRLVKGQERFYDANVENSYYVINRKDGFVDYYDAGSLDWQQVIEE